jgi:MarR family transcriptional regulator, organic hydroperoxide resistance regulator
MDARSGEDPLDQDLFDALAGLIARLITEGEKLAREFGIPAVMMKALHSMDAPLAMKDVGKRLRCDPSFVTTVADMLEQRGLAMREPDPGDRRVKRLVLTPAGVQLRSQLELAMVGRMPWHGSLTRDERASLLALINKMSPPLPASAGNRPAGEVEDFLSATAPPPTAVRG